MNRIKVMSVFGTRPEAIKMAPLLREFERREEIESITCVTAQHREALDCVLRCFDLKPDYDLNIMSKSQTLYDVTANVLKGMEVCLNDARPDLVLVHGDTSTTFAAALAAFFAKVPVGHVEAGLRTCNLSSPFPEEANRCLVGRLAQLHFAPTAKNAENLRAEAVPGDIFITGNTVIDAMQYTAQGKDFNSDELKHIDFSRRVITLTCHRRENYGEAMENIFSAVRELAESFNDVLFVYPLHMSPSVREAAHGILDGLKNVKLTEPLDPMDMHRLMRLSYMVMTDSGGIQEEAPALGKPVLLLRRETERPEAVEAGTVRLSGVDKDSIIRDAKELLSNSSVYEKMAHAVNPYGDGHACERIADAVLFKAGLRNTAPEEFKVK